MTTTVVEVPASKQSLSMSRTRLLEKMQEMNFGRIHQIEVRDGEPAFTPTTRIERHIKFGGENRPRPESGLDDFTLKRNVIELFETFERLGNGTIKQLEIKGGLPFGMIIEEQAV